MENLLGLNPGEPMASIYKRKKDLSLRNDYSFAACAASELDCLKTEVTIKLVRFWVGIIDL
jgi:hypothetical protein